MSSVVVGVGGSPENWQTLAWAVAEAGETGKRLVVCHACAADSALAAPGGGARIALLELVEPALARAVTAARMRLGGERVTVVARAESPGELLVDSADESDLLVVGPPTHPGWIELGSITHYVVRNARCAVVVVRSSSEAGDTGPRGPFRGHVVVGVDGSPAARAALEFGFTHAAEHRQPMVAVHVTSRGHTDLWFDEELLETHLTAEPAALALLAEEVEPWQHKYPDVAVKRAVFVGRPLEGLLRASSGATVLVLGDSRHGRARQLLGSVTHGAIDQARCPVAVLHGNVRGRRPRHDPYDH